MSKGVRVPRILLPTGLRSGQGVGIALVALAGTFWSMQGLMVRMIEVATGPQIIFWRSIGQLVATLAVVAVVSHGRIAYAFQVAGIRGLLMGLFHALAGVSFVLALLQTTVANVVFILASAPLIAAAGSWLLFRERPSVPTMCAMLAAAIGIAIMVLGRLAAGNLIGPLLALLCAFGFAGMAMVARSGRHVNLMPGGCIGAGLTIVIGLFMSGGLISAPVPDIAFALASGGLLTVCGMILFLYGAKFVPAGSLAFASQTEIVLAPIWVWVVFNEAPSTNTLVGGSIVLAAIFFEAASRVHRRS